MSAQLPDSAPISATVPQKAASATVEQTIVNILAVAQTMRLPWPVRLQGRFAAALVAHF